MDFKIKQNFYSIWDPNHQICHFDWVLLFLMNSNNDYVGKSTPVVAPVTLDTALFFGDTVSEYVLIRSKILLAFVFYNYFANSFTSYAVSSSSNVQSSNFFLARLAAIHWIIILRWKLPLKAPHPHLPEAIVLSRFSC